LRGAAVFAAFELPSSNGTSEPGSVVVTRGKIDSLVTSFTRTWQRPPTETELEDLLRDLVREEIYCREALALGLDRDDTIIRRRLRQKLELVAEDLVALAEPSDEELRAHLESHADAFRVDGRLSFVHVSLRAERRRDALAADAEKLLAELRRAGGEADISGLGDPTLLELKLEDVPTHEVVRQ